MLKFAFLDVHLDTEGGEDYFIIFSLLFTDLVKINDLNALIPESVV